jgi:hypothetical protein
MAANSMTPSLSPAPMGLEELADIAQDDTPAVEIMIDNPDDVEIGIDGMTIDLMPEEETAEEFGANLAEYMDDGELQKLASELVELVDADVNSRKDWVEMYVKGLKCWA